MKKAIIFSLAALMTANAMAIDVKVASPDGKLQVTISDDGGKPTYVVNYDGKQMMTPSALGLNTNIGDFTQGLTIKDSKENSIDSKYTMSRTKASEVHYQANEVNITMENAKKWPLTVTFRVSNSDVAFRYTLHRGKGNNPKCAVIYSEASAFNFPDYTTTFICPQSKTMGGWERTKPSYEEEYTADAAMDVKSKFSEGYTFPCLFHVGNDGWVLVSETGTGSNYAGCHLSDYEKGKGRCSLH